MDVGTVVLIAVTAWASLFVVVLALCRAAARADAHGHRSYRAIRRHADAHSDRYSAALR